MSPSHWKQYRISDTESNHALTQQPATKLANKWLAIGTSAITALALGLGWFLWWQRPVEKREIVLQQLTARTGDNPIRGAVLSRDGRYLAYSDSGGISIQEIANRDVHGLPGTAGLEIQDWYPDGLRLLVKDREADLWTLFAVSGEKRKLTSHVGCATLSPDGSQIAFRRKSFPRELWTMPTATGREPHVSFALAEEESFMGCPAWSPDGRSVAYIRFNRTLALDKAAVLESRTLEDGKTQALLTDYGGWSLGGDGDNGVCWLPDGRILFGLYKGPPESDLWALSLNFSGTAAGKPVRLTNTTGSAIAGLSASADGTRVAIVFARGSLALFVASLNKAEGKLEQPQRLTPDSWNYMPDGWSADGQTLFYESHETQQGRTKASIYKRRMLSDAAELFLAGPDSYAMQDVSPDGKWVIVTANRRVPGKGSLLRVPITGGTPETITTLAGMADLHCAQTGSRICVLAENIGEQKVFSILDPVRGRMGELTKIDIKGKAYTDWSLSPNGGSIALVERQSDGVLMLDLQSKQIRVIHPMPPQALQVPAWWADGKQLFLSGFSDTGDGVLLEMDLSGHTRMLLENPGGWIGDPTPSPDGKRIAYSYSVGESNVTLLEHF